MLKYLDLISPKWLNIFLSPHINHVRLKKNIDMTKWVLSYIEKRFIKQQRAQL